MVVQGKSRDILEIDIALGRITVPVKHGVDSLRELGAVRFVDAASVTLAELSEGIVALARA